MAKRRSVSKPKKVVSSCSPDTIDAVVDGATTVTEVVIDISSTAATTAGECASGILETIGECL